MIDYISTGLVIDIITDGNQSIKQMFIIYVLFKFSSCVTRAITETIFMNVSIFWFYTNIDKMQKILQGLRVAQAAVTERWP